MKRLLKPSTILSRLVSIARKEREIHKKYRDDMEDLRLQRLEIQKLCPHPKVEFYPDPAGGFGSFYECSTCKMERKNKKDFDRL